MEEWKPYRDGSYSVSNEGRVMRIKPAVNARVGEIKKVGTHSCGYLQFCAYDSGRQTNHFVHRAVAECFIGTIPNGMEVNHKNGIKTDNRVENLEIVTRSENCLHAIANGLAIPFKNRKIHTGDDHWTRKRPELIKTRGANNGARIHPDRIWRGSQCRGSKLKDPQILEIRNLHASGIHETEIAKQYGVTRENIRAITSRKTWKHL